ncbi:hypothetical protein GN958_ATG19908, partial [Phytophthora infestans]
NAPRVKHCIADVSGRGSSPTTDTLTPLRQAISAQQDRFTEADTPSMTDDEFPAQFELISSPGGDGQDDDSERDFVSDPGSSSVDDDGDDDFEPPTDSSDSSDTLQELLNEIGTPKDAKRKRKRIPRRKPGVESYGTNDGSVADTESLPPTDEEREDADVENVQLDLQDPNTDRTPRVRRTESYPERVA